MRKLKQRGQEDPFECESASAAISPPRSEAKSLPAPRAWEPTTLTVDEQMDRLAVAAAWCEQEIASWGDGTPLPPDAKIERRWQDVVWPFGKWKGVRLGVIASKDGSYVRWVRDTFERLDPELAAYVKEAAEWTRSGRA